MKKGLSVILEVLLLLGTCTSCMKTVCASASEMREYTQLKDISYDPMEQGYYGYFPVHYEENGELLSTAVLALVKDGHTYLNAEDICQRLDMKYESDPKEGTFEISFWQRTVTFRKDSGRCTVKIGLFLVEYTMPVATVYQDDAFWVGAEWLFWILGGTFLPDPDGYVVIGAPHENVLDVLAELSVDNGAFDYLSDFGISSDEMEKIDKAFRTFDTYDGVFMLEPDQILSAVAAASRIPGSAYVPDTDLSKLITEPGYGSDFMKVLLNASVDEIYSISDGAADAADWVADKMSGKLAEVFDVQSLNSNLDAVEGSLNLVDAAKAGDGAGVDYWFRYSNSKLYDSMLQAKISGIIEGLGKAENMVPKMIDTVECLSAYSRRDRYAMEGARTVIDCLNSNETFWQWNGLSELVIKSMNGVLTDYECDRTDFILTRMFKEHGWEYINELGRDWIFDFLKKWGRTVSPASFALLTDVFYQLGSRLMPGYVSKLEKTEALEKSLIGVLYQSAAYTVCIDAVNKAFPEKTPLLSIRDQGKPYEVEMEAKELDQAVSQAYHYIKTRYVTRELALIALKDYSDMELYQAQEGMQERELELLEIISGYYQKDLPIPEQWDIKNENYDDSYLQAIVTPAYLHTAGCFVDSQTGNGIRDVSVCVQDEQGNQTVMFTSGEDGTFDAYVPIQWESEWAKSLQKTLDFEGDFLPWQESCRRSFAYPQVQTDTSVIWKGRHDDYGSFTRKVSGFQMTELEGQGPSRELFLDTGNIYLGIDYYGFIRDELIPRMGLADLGTAQKLVKSEHYETTWNPGEGLLGADIADLNLDGMEDLLVYYIADDHGLGQNSDGTYPKGIYAGLYSVAEDGSIEFVAARELAGYDDITYNRIRLGLMEQADRIFLYVEYDRYAYLANGGAVSYTWYGWDENGDFRPWWLIGDKYGGSCEINCTLYRYYDEKNYDDYVLWADSGFRYAFPEKEVLMNETDGYGYETEYAIQSGFHMLGLEAAGIYENSPNKYFTQSGRLPTFWGTEFMKESVSYLCTLAEQGEGYNSGTRYVKTYEVTVSVEDRTGLREKSRISVDGRYYDE